MKKKYNKKIKGYVNVYKSLIFDIYITGPVYESKEKALKNKDSIFGLYIDTVPISFNLYDINNIKMNEAGYELDTEKKELKKIEQKPAWSEEDEERYLSCLKRLSTGNIEQPETVNTVWLKSLKDRYTWKPSDEMLEALYKAVPDNVKEMSEDEMLLDKLYQGLKYGRVLSEN